MKMSLPGITVKRVILFSYLLGFLWVLGYDYPLYAAESPAQTVRVRIGTILASNQSDEIDPKLDAMRSQLKVMKYRSYRLIKEETQNVLWQSNAAFDIPGGRSLMVTPQESRGSQLALKVRLQHGDKPIVDTTVRLNSGGNFLLGGPQHEGGVLVLSIWATAQ